jgi:MerR family transcriptional regulator, light-induced transcriptional regulator
VDGNSSVVNELRSVVERIAQAAVAKDYARRPALLAKYGDRGRTMYLQDSRFHIFYLADAIRFGRPSIFKDYLAWLAEVLSARGVAPEELSENLKCVRDALIETLTPASLPAVLAVFEAALAGGGDETSASSRRADDALPAYGLARRYLDLLLRGDRQAALGLLQDAIRDGTGIREIWLRVFQDSQYEVGRLWQSNQINIAQEHYCTAATQMSMSRLYSQVFSGPHCGRTLVTACAPGEIHELGMRMVADLFEMEGWDTYHLGANMPAAALGDFIAQRRPNLVGLSATMTFHLDGVAAIIGALRERKDIHDITIMVGGRAFNREPGLWRQIGADGHARDVESALTVAETLPAAAQG